MTNLMPLYDDDDKQTWRAFMAAALAMPGDYSVEDCASVADSALREYGWRVEAGEMELRKDGDSS